MPNSCLNIEVVYASQASYRCISLQVEAGCTIEKAIMLSGLLALYPEIDLKHNQVGIFNKIKALDEQVQAGDRVEIYRPLCLSPIEARKRRAQTQKLKQRSQAKDHV